MKSKNSKNGKILIVEDDAGVAEVLCLMLSEYDPILAMDGRKAVQLYKLYRPNLVLMDIRLPGVDGVEATRRILKIDPEAKIIGLTAFGRKWGKDLLEAGALDILNKPFRRKELIEIVERYK